MKIMQALLWRNVTLIKPMLTKLQIEKIVIKSLRCNYLNKLVFTHLCINSFRNNFEFLSGEVIDNIDVLMVSETKIDNSFPIGNFLIHGFSPPYRLDRDSKGCRIMIYIREDIKKL